MIDKHLLEYKIKAITSKLLREWGDSPLTDKRREELRINREKEKYMEDSLHSSIMTQIQRLVDIEDFELMFQQIITRVLNKKFSFNRAFEKNPNDFSSNKEFAREELKAFVNKWNETFGSRLIMYIRDIETTIPDIILIDDSIKGNPNNLPYEQRMAKFTPLKLVDNITPKSPKEQTGLKICKFMRDFMGKFTKNDWWEKEQW